MAHAEFISEEDYERRYRINTGQIITLKLEEDWSQITFWGNDIQLGNDMDFVFTEMDDSCENYLLSRMYIPIKNVGLGRAALEFFADETGSNVYCRSNDGIVRDDGSHLTEDAHGFVIKMNEEGLILFYDEGEFDEGEFDDED